MFLAIHVQQREVDSSVLQAPTLILGEFDHRAFGVQEQEILGGRDWK